MSAIPKGELKFLLASNLIYVNTASDSPIHLVLGYLTGLVPKDKTLEILGAGSKNFESKCLELMGRALLGGYCSLVSENPLQFEYTKPSGSVPPAFDSEFNSAQSKGNITLINYTTQDAADSDLYKI